MTPRPRPSLSASTLRPRPSSAIFIGGAASSDLPELPEPPSPGGSSSSVRSTHTGLPSPPATNSTGSGSTGDHCTTSRPVPSLDRAASLPPPLNPTDTPFNPTDTHNILVTNENATAKLYYDEDDVIPARFLTSAGGVAHNGDRVEDNRAGQSTSSFASARSPGENVLALQRVRTLAHRNRIALDRLTSYPSRLSSLSPISAPPSTPPLHRTHTPHPSTSSGKQRQHTSPRQALSGSETELENLEIPEAHDEFSSPPSSTPASHVRSIPSYPQFPTSSSARRPLSQQSPTQASVTGAIARSLSQQRRHASDLPTRSLPSQNAISERREMNGALRTTRRTINMAVVDHLFDRDRHRDRGSEKDVTAAALAAVASVRESGSIGAGLRPRSAIPREFRETESPRERKSIDDRPVSVNPIPPQYRPHIDDIEHNFQMSHASPSPKSFRSLALNGSTNSFAERWAINGSSRKRSDTIRGPPEGSGVGVSRLPLDNLAAERRAAAKAFDNQTGKRSLVGQGLKAAGILRKASSSTAESEDIFSADFREYRKRTRLGSVVGAVAGILGPKGKGKGRDLQDWLNREATTRDTRSADGIAVGNAVEGRNGLDVKSDCRTTPSLPTEHSSTQMHPDVGDHDGNFGERQPSYPPARPWTPSRANETKVGHADNETLQMKVAQTPLSSSPGERDKARSAAGSRQGLHYDRDRYTSPLHVGSTVLSRYGASTPISRQPSPGLHLRSQNTNPDHGRLMVEALKAFESQLLRLPNTTAVSDLFRSAQSVVHMTEKVNVLTRTGMNKALQEQIDSEMSDEGDRVSAESWRMVHSNYRDSLRVSDELVRTVTGFMLDMGKVLKGVSMNEHGAAHTRTVSLDLEERHVAHSDAGSVRRSLDENRSSEGRRSAASHRSSERASDSLRRLATRSENTLTPSARPSSSLASFRDRDRRSSTDDYRELRSPPPRSITSASSRNFSDLVSSRRFAIQDHIDNQDPRVSFAESVDSTATIRALAPSPTPPERIESDRTLLDLSLGTGLSQPEPDPSPPSRANARADKSLRRRSNLVSMTVPRGSHLPPTLGTIATPGATTAVTPHTVSSPDINPSPVSRGSSGSHYRTRTVTFSRPAAVSISALSGVQQQDNRKRTVSQSSSNPGEATTASPPAIKKSHSSSDTDKDSRRRTLAFRTRGSLDTERLGAQSQGHSRISEMERRQTLTEIFS